MNELNRHLNPVEKQPEEQPRLIQVGNKFKFEDGNRLYNSEESAKNALNGFNKYKAKREEISQLIYKKSYEETVAEMDEQETKEYIKSISGKF